MNKIINKILIGLIIFCGTSLISTGFALAESSELTVDFEKTPLFSEANFLPGESITRWAKITNNSDQVQPIAVEAINISDSDNLGEKLDLKIYEGVNVRYSGSLNNFLNAGKTYLSDLANDANTQYDFNITFQSGTDNPFQGKTLGFDILIGFQSEGSQDGGNDDDNNNGSTGGGGYLPGLTITNERSEVTESSATVIINWQTSYFSTSQVIYGTTLDQFDFSEGPEKYGYAFSTIEDLTKVTGHSVELTGLIPNTTYYYRCVSHASPATISYEGTFTTSYSETYSEISGEEEINKTGGEETEGASEGIANRTSEEVTSRTSEEEIEEIGEEEIDRTGEEETKGTEEIVIAPEEEQTKENPQLLAAIGSLVSFGTGNVPVGIVVSISILLIVFFIVKGIYTYIKKDK